MLPQAKMLEVTRVGRGKKGSSLRCFWKPNFGPTNNLILDFWSLNCKNELINFS